MVTRILGDLLVVATLLPAAIYLREDYLDFLSLGPGGTPQTVYGYLKIKLLGLFAVRNRFLAAPVPDNWKPKHGYLKALQRRPRPRPVVKGIAPHRQINQIPDKHITEQLAAAIEAMAPGVNNDFVIGTSCFEKHSTGLFSTAPVNHTCRGEIVHSHASDGSMHLTLHPADAQIALEAGWAERHPLAGLFGQYFVPTGFLMLYAPMNEEEIEVALEVVRAAAWFVSGGKCYATADHSGISNVPSDASEQL